MGVRHVFWIPLVAACARDDVAPGEGRASGDSVAAHAREGLSALVVRPDGTQGCEPVDPAAETLYGCWVEVDDPDDRDDWQCIPPNFDRFRVRGDEVILEMSPRCAAGELWDVRVDGVQVPTNHIVWGEELRIPLEVASGPMPVDLAGVEGVTYIWRRGEERSGEEEACGHPIEVAFNHEGDRRTRCRTEWSSYTLAAGDEPGFLAGGHLQLTAFDPTPGGAVAIDAAQGVCGRGPMLAWSVDEPAVEAICCQTMSARLTWRTPDALRLEMQPDSRPDWGGSECCGALPVEPRMVESCAGNLEPEW